LVLLVVAIMLTGRAGDHLVVGRLIGVGTPAPVLLAVTGDEISTVGWVIRREVNGSGTNCLDN
jgi:hypothetical protein